VTAEKNTFKNFKIFSTKIAAPDNEHPSLNWAFYDRLWRVIAYNDAGPSDPGDPSDPVVIDVPGVQESC
jgi:hypothetical protein